MEFRQLSIPGVYWLDAHWIGDQRGGFARLFCQKEFAPHLGGASLCQINYSVNRDRGTVRGLHFQKPPHSEIKVVRCIKGAIFDVVVDLRHGSPTFLRHIAVTLSVDNKGALLIPHGCAHGFQVLNENSEVLYFHTEYYTPTAEGGVRYNDPVLGIDWPLAPVNLSDRDQSHPLLTAQFSGISLPNFPTL